MASGLLVVGVLLILIGLVALLLGGEAMFRRSVIGKRRFGERVSPLWWQRTLLPNRLWPLSWDERAGRILFRLAIAGGLLFVMAAAVVTIF